MNKEDEFIYFMAEYLNPDLVPYLYCCETEKGLCFVGSLGEMKNRVLS